MVRFPLPRIGLNALAVADLIEDQDRASGPRPQYAHILQFKLRFRRVQAVGNDNSWHRSAGFARQIEIRGDPESRPGLIHDVLPAVAIAPEFFHHFGVERPALWKLADGCRERLPFGVAKTLPVIEGPDALPIALLCLQNLACPIANVAIQHFGERHLLALPGPEHPRWSKGQAACRRG